MAKVRRKKTHKTTKRSASKRVATSKLKGRRPVRKTPAKRRKQRSLVDAVREAVTLRGRLTGHNTFED